MTAAYSLNLNCSSKQGMVLYFYFFVRKLLVLWKKARYKKLTNKIRIPNIYNS